VIAACSVSSIAASGEILGDDLDCRDAMPIEAVRMSANSCIAREKDAKRAAAARLLGARRP